MTQTVDSPFATQSAASAAAPVAETSMAARRHGTRWNGRYKLPLLPGEQGPKAGGDWVPGGLQSVTNMLDGFEDQRGLQMWEQEGLLYGLVKQPSLFEEAALLAAEADRKGIEWSDLGGGYQTDPELVTRGKEIRKLLHGANDRDAAETSIVGRAKQAAGFNEARQAGTNRHTAWEHFCATGELIGTPAMQDQVRAMYELITEAGLEIVPELSERVVRNVALKCAGRFDNILWYAILRRFIMADLKGLALDTLLATPNGWTTMGAVRVGDQVYDKDGVPCRVTAKSETKRIGTYVVTFDDGSKIVCDSEHIWITGIVGGRSYRHSVQPRSIQEIIETQRNPSSGQNQHVVPVAGVLQAPHDSSLPIKPYLLGVWLGDGAAKAGTISKERDLLETMETLGYQHGAVTVDKRSPNVLYWTIPGLQTALRAAGLFGNKHIPDAYLRASAPQRTDLLRGLMDTDGTWNKRRRTAVFNSTDKALAHQVAELLSTLGQRPHVAEYTAKGYGKVVTAYAVEFTPIGGLQPFYLYRKAVQAATSTKSTVVAERRMIASIEPGPDMETACIAVDAPSATYLAGERMIPTHNTKRKPFRSFASAEGQLATYARSEWMLEWDGQDVRYVPGPLHHVDQKLGVVLIMPSNGDKPYLKPADLEYGWEVAQHARRSHELRSFGSRRAHLDRTWPPEIDGTK